MWMPSSDQQRCIDSLLWLFLRPNLHQPIIHYASKLEVILIEQAAQKLHGSHQCWISWPALDKRNLLQPSSASTRESENSWPGLWLPCLLRRLPWVVAETMKLSTHQQFLISHHLLNNYIFSCVFSRGTLWMVTSSRSLPPGFAGAKSWELLVVRAGGREAKGGGRRAGGGGRNCALIHRSQFIKRLPKHCFKYGVERLAVLKGD